MTRCVGRPAPPRRGRRSVLLPLLVLRRFSPMSLSPDLLRAPAALEGASAEEILTWAIEAFFPDIAVACSMQDGVLVDLAVRIEPRIEVCFLETGFHFPETLQTARPLQERYRLKLVELTPAASA